MSFFESALPDYSRMQMTRSIVLWLFMMFIPLFSTHDDQMSELYQYLMSKYNKDVRPVRKNSDIVSVKLGLKLIQIADVVRILNVQ